MSVDDPSPPRSVPVKGHITAVEEKNLKNASVHQYYVFSVYLYIARIPEFISHPDCPEDAKDVMLRICGHLGWDRKKPIWEVFTYQNAEDFLMKRQADRFKFDKLIYQNHLNMIRLGILKLPYKWWELPPNSTEHLTRNYISREGRRSTAKRRRIKSDEAEDPQLRVEKRQRKAYKQYYKQGFDVKTNKFPLWRILVRRLEKHSLLAFTSGSDKGCLFIKDHNNSASKGNKYYFSRSWKDKTKHINIEKFIRFHLYPPSMHQNYRSQPPNDMCHQFKSHKGCILCVNPIHYGQVINFRAGDETNTRPKVKISSAF